MLSSLMDSWTSLGLLVLRVGAGLILFGGHGLSKLMNYGSRAGNFADPIGLGPQVGFTLVVFAEVFCALAVALGFLTRLAAVPLVTFFSIAFFIQHAADPFQRKELALVFGIIFLTILLTGPGRYSLDALIARAFAGRRARTTTSLPGGAATEEVVTR